MVGKDVTGVSQYQFVDDSDEPDKMPSEVWDWETKCCFFILYRIFFAFGMDLFGAFHATGSSDRGRASGSIAEEAQSPTSGYHNLDISRSLETEAAHDAL